MYTNATTDAANAALRARPGPAEAPMANAPAAGTGDATAPMGIVAPPTATPDDPDAAPASKPPKSKTPPPAKEDDVEGGDTSKPGEAGEGTLLNGDVGKK